MIWLIIVVVGLIIYFTMKGKTNNKISSSLLHDMSLLIHVGSTEEKANLISREIFEIALKSSNKNVTYEYVSNMANVLQNPDLLHYAGVFSLYLTKGLEMSLLLMIYFHLYQKILFQGL